MKERAWPKARGLSDLSLIAITTLFIVAVHNEGFYRAVAEVYRPGLETAPKFASLTMALAGLTLVLLTLCSPSRILKLTLASFLVLASVTSFFIDNYGAIVHPDMWRNVVLTDSAEVHDLITLRLLGWVALTGVLPAAAICFAPRAPRTSLRSRLGTKALTLGVSLAVVVVAVLPFGRFYASFLREHKPLRYQANPIYACYSLVKLGLQSLEGGPREHQTLDLAASRVSGRRRRLMIMVVGEAARADRFSLNGYARSTNPRLSQEEVFSFQDVESCGTSTAISVPCMFSLDTRSEFDPGTAGASDNALDILQRTGVSVLWRDNNSDSKGVALRVPYQDFRTSATNPDCDGECRDVGMLDGLQAHFDSRPDDDMLVVLHQLGNHGPAYYKRYPPSFEVFRPAATSSQLDDCTPQEINNAYDNAIRYTDYFLSEVIQLLKANSKDASTTMLYVGDHGESLGEHGIYLHGLPRGFAPDAQTHVPLILWLGEAESIDRPLLRESLAYPISQDAIAQTLLGAFQVRSSLYDPVLDLLAPTRMEPELASRGETAFAREPVATRHPLD